MMRSWKCLTSRRLCFASVLFTAFISTAPVQPAFAQDDCAAVLATAEAEGRYRASNTLPAGFIATAVGVHADATMFGCGRPSSGERLVTGTLIHVDDIVETGERGRVRVELDDRDDNARAGPSVLNIGPLTKLRIQSFVRNPQRSNLDLIRGAIRYFFKASPEKNDSFRVSAGTSICGIRGSDALIAHGPDSTTPLVAMLNEGHMTVRSGGRSVDLRPGEAVSTEKDGSISAPERFEPVVWDAAIAVFIDGDIGGFDFDIHLNGEPPT